MTWPEAQNAGNIAPFFENNGNKTTQQKHTQLNKMNKETLHQL